MVKLILGPIPFGVLFAGAEGMLMTSAKRRELWSKIVAVSKQKRKACDQRVPVIGAFLLSAPFCDRGLPVINL